MSINGRPSTNVFEEGVITNTIRERTTDHGVEIKDDLVADSEFRVDTIKSNKSSNVNIHNSLFTNNQGQIPVLKTDVIEEITTNQRVSFPDGIKVDEIAVNTTGENILFNNNVDMGNLRVNTINKLTSDLTINLGHTDASSFNYFSAYSNSSTINFSSDNSDLGRIETGGLQLLRINTFVFCRISLYTFVSPQDSFGDTTSNPIPARFRPPRRVNSRTAMTSNSATATWAYLNIQTDGNFRVGCVSSGLSLSIFPGGQYIENFVMWNVL